MQLKALQIGTDLREHFPYSCNSIPLCICIDNFDDYLHREWGCQWHEEIEFGIVRKGTVQFTIYNGQEQFCKEAKVKRPKEKSKYQARVFIPAEPM